MQTITKKFILLGIIILSFLATPAIASAATQFQLDYPGGTAVNGESVECDALPCPVTGKINSADKPISYVDWQAGGGEPTLRGSGPNYSASWSYTTEGQHSYSYTIHFMDGTVEGRSSYIQVVNPQNANATVTYVGPDTLYQEDDTRNTFQVDYSGTNLGVQWNGNGGGPVLLRKWTDSAGRHAQYRFTAASPGQGQLQLESGDTIVLHTVQIVGGPVAPRPAFTSLTVSQYSKKKGGKCVYGTRLATHANQTAKAQVKVHLEGKRKGTSWKRLAKGGTPLTFFDNTLKSDWALNGQVKFSRKSGVVAKYLKHHAKFRYVVDRTRITSNGSVYYNPKSTTFAISSRKLNRCAFSKPPKVVRVPQLP